MAWGLSHLAGASSHPAPRWGPWLARCGAQILPLSQGSAPRMNEETRRIFSELGSSVAKELGFRDSWVFVGAKGVQDKSPFEQVSPSTLPFPPRQGPSPTPLPVPS